MRVEVYATKSNGRIEHKLDKDKVNRTVIYIKTQGDVRT